MHILSGGGIIAAGHLETAKAAEEILINGGNAYDAALAALMASFVCEPTLTSLGGGGFMTAYTAEKEAILFDFFVQTPHAHKPVEDLDFEECAIDFGETQQSQYIGKASVAVPGCPAGIAHIHQKLCTMPLTELAKPAIRLAKEGVLVSEYQAYTMAILKPILLHSAEIREIFQKNKDLIKVGSTLQQPKLADSLDYLAKEGFEDFYHGEIGKLIVADHHKNGGILQSEDLRAYHLIERKPLSIPYRRWDVITNPPPSMGGSMIAYGLGAINQRLPEKPKGATYIKELREIIREMDDFREAHLNPNLKEGKWEQDKIEHIFQLVARQRKDWLGNTTHFSVIDRKGNAASVTTTLGGMSGHSIPGTGICTNNMLGELDLNPLGYHKWSLNKRVSSMMAPTIVLDQGNPYIVLGTGGSSRIRTAILQVLIHILEYKMPLSEAVNYPRLHAEGNILNFEPHLLGTGELNIPGIYISQWKAKNMYFGGVHTAMRYQDGTLDAMADPRRDGTVKMC